MNWNSERHNDTKGMLHIYIIISPAHILSRTLRYYYHARCTIIIAHGARNDTYKRCISLPAGPQE